MRKFLLLALLAVWLALPLTAQAHKRPADLRLLRDVICGQPDGLGGFETRGEANPDAARGQSDEIGRCQIRPGTARDMGFSGELKLLENGFVSRYFALKYLRYCSGRLRTDDPERIAHCYNGGPGLPWEGIGSARIYAAAVMVKYRQAWRSRMIAVAAPWKGAWL